MADADTLIGEEVADDPPVLRSEVEEVISAPMNSLRKDNISDGLIKAGGDDQSLDENLQ